MFAFTHAAGQPSESGRRYLNDVFGDHIRTADIVYAERVNDTTGKREKLTMRVFEPADDDEDNRPLFILTPGGGFVQHDEHWMDEWGRQIARAGYVVAIHRYRLSDSLATTEKYMNALFKAFADQKAVIRYFVEDARGANRFRADPHNLFIGGHSAGAITSMHVAYLDSTDAIDKEMTEALDRHGGLNGSGTGKTPGYTLRGVINLSGLVTDLDIIDKGEPALISIHGDRDGIIPVGTGDGMYGSIPIHERAESQGLENDLYVLKGARHNDPADPELCPECIPLVRRFMFNAQRVAEGD